MKNYLRMKISKRINLKIGILENYLKIEVWKIKFENWSFEKLFERNWNFENYLRIGAFKN